MIFKMADSSSGGVGDRLTIFNKSITNMKRDYLSGNGLFTSLFSGKCVTSNDIKSISKMAEAIENNSTVAQAWQANMKNCTIAAKEQAKQCLLNHGNLSELAKGLEQSTVAAKAGQIALKGLASAGNMLAIWAISKGFEFVAQGIDNIIHRVEHLNEKALKSKEDYNNLNEKVESVNKELETTKQHISELNAKKNLSLVEQDELNRLKQRNDELERELKIRKQLANTSAKQANEDAKKALNTNVNYGYYNGKNYVSVHGNQIDTALSKLKHYQFLQEKIKITQKKMDSIISKNPENYKKDSEYRELKDTYSSIVYQSDGLEKEIADNIKTLMELDDSLLTTDSESKKLLDDLSICYAKYDEIFNATDETAEDKINKILSRPTLESTKESLVELGKSGNLSVDILNNSFSNLVKLLEESGVSAQELYRYIMALANPDLANINAVKQALYKQFVQPYEGTDETDLNKIKENYYSWLDSMSDEQLLIAYSIINNNDTSGWSFEDFNKKIEESQKQIKISAFFDTFSSLPTKKLDEYITLINSGSLNEKTISSYEDLSRAMRETGISAEDAIQAIKEYSELQPSSIDLTTQIQDSYNILTKLKNELNSTGQIGLDSLSMIAKQFPELATATAEYTQGLLSANDLMGLLEIAYNNDADAFRSAMIAKLSGNESFFETIKNNNQELFDSLANAYELDVGNWKTLAQAKADIENSLVAQLANKWGKYYGSFDANVIKGKDGQYSLVTDDPTLIYESGYQEIEDTVAEHNKIIRSLNEAANIEIKIPNLDGTSNNSASSSPKSEETKEIDGIKRKVDLLRESYEKLNNEANDSDNHYSTQLNFLNAAITKEEDLIALEKEAAKAYKAQWEAKSAGLSAEEKDLIMNGSTDIKQFSGKKYNEVTEAQSAWDKYKSMLDSIETDEEKLLGSQKNRYQKKIELIQDEIDTLKDKADYSRIDYHTQIAYLDEALAKSKNLMKTMSEKADEAKRKWNEAKNNIASIDIARIMNNDLDINNYDDKEYASRLEEASKLYGEYLNSEKELDEQVKSDAELQKEAYEKAIEYITAQQELFSNKNASIQSDIDLIDELGGVVGADVYQDMINNNEKLIDLYEQQREEAEDYLSELDDDCPEYYEALSEIEDCNDAIKNCKIEQVKWNEEIKRLPVERLSKYLSILGYIKQDLQNFIDEQASLNIATTKDQYQGLVDISKKQIDKLLEQQKNLKNLLSEYSYGSEKFNDVSGEIQDIDNEISELIQSQNDWNRSMLEIPVNKLTEAKEQLQNISDALSNTISDYDTAISAVGSIIDKQVETLNAEKGAIEDKYTDRINPLQEELDLLKAKTEEENLQLTLEEKQAALEKAKQNTNNKVMKNGVFEYRADIEEIQNAQKELEDAVYNKKVNDLESQISGLEEERDKLLAGYDEQIEKLDKIKDRWSSISSDIKLAADAIKANELLGAGWENKVLTGNDDGIYNSMKEMYSLASNQKDQYDKLITQSEYIADLMSQYIEKWQNGAITYDQAISGVNDLLTKLQTGFSNSDYLDSLIGLSNGNSLAEILTNMQSTTSDSLNQFREYLESAQSNKELFTKYASSWEEMKANIAREIEALENAARALENTSNTNRGHSSDSNSSSKKKKSSKKRSSGGGPNVNDHRIVLSGPGMALLKHHTGINAGYVGKEMDSPDKRLKAIGDFINGKSLKQNEVPVVLEKGEVLLNDGQQQMLYKRINELESGTSFSAPTLNCNKMIPSNNNDVSKSMVNNFYGGINIEEAQNVVDIAKGIQNGMFKQILKREIMKPDW